MKVSIISINGVEIARCANSYFRTMLPSLFKKYPNSLVGREIIETPDLKPVNYEAAKGSSYLKNGEPNIDQEWLNKRKRKGLPT